MSDIKRQVVTMEAHKQVVHLAGFHVADGEPTILAVCVMRDLVSNDPDCCDIIVGEPGKSPLMDGAPIPRVGGFSCGADAAERLAHELLAAAALAREARRG